MPLSRIGLSQNQAVTGNITLSNSNSRIFGVNPTFQTSDANTTSRVLVIPSGTGQIGSFIAYNSSNTSNASLLTFRSHAGTGLTQILSESTGSGTNLPLAIYTGGSERVRLEANGVFNLISGQLQFPATQNSSSDPNTLDDYEEGTWTPRPTFGSGSTGLTTSTTQGSYVKIGRMVMIQGRVAFTNRGSSTGSFFVRDLPFTCAQADGDANNRFYSGAIIGYADFVATGSVWASAQIPTIDTGTTYILFRYINTSNGRYNDHTQASLTNTTDIIFSAFYQTST